MNKVITISAPVAAGKSSLSKELHELLGTNVFYEPVSAEENPILPLYYEDQSKYGFLLQIFFLNKRFEQIKEAYKTHNAIIDSSIYTDSIFLHRLHNDGMVTDQELSVYENLFSNMMEEIDGLPYKKTPDLMISIKLSLDTELSRIYTRGREFEQTDALKEYWNNLLSDYNAWIDAYNISPKLVIDGDKYDFVNDNEDKKHVLNVIVEKLFEIGELDFDEVNMLKEKIYSLETEK